ncbi:MAG: YdeI/OmpD-associated family protein [Polyangiaceae bacterium]|nr:YdeI/OmpD-associated family protein [Polyangiaceae bacterium]
MYVAWVLTAKRAETRARRIQTVVSRSARGVKPGIDL